MRKFTSSAGKIKVPKPVTDTAIHVDKNKLSTAAARATRRMKRKAKKLGMPIMDMKDILKKK